MVVPFKWPLRVRGSTWRRSFQSATDLFYSVIYKPNKVEDRLLPTVQLGEKKHFAKAYDTHHRTKTLQKVPPLILSVTL